MGEGGSSLFKSSQPSLCRYELTIYQWWIFHNLSKHSSTTFLLLYSLGSDSRERNLHKDLMKFPPPLFFFLIWDKEQLGSVSFNFWAAQHKEYIHFTNLMEILALLEVKEILFRLYDLGGLLWHCNSSETSVWDDGNTCGPTGSQLPVLLVS